MRSKRTALALVTLALVSGAWLTACDSGDDNGDSTATPGAAATSPAKTSSAGDTTPKPAGTPSSVATAGVTAAAGSVEVRGIVGAVSAQNGTIEISRLSGADVTTIKTSSATRIRRARGGTATLAEIRSSDRIIATGTVNNRGALEATEIAVEDVVPGAAPGG